MHLKALCKGRDNCLRVMWAVALTLVMQGISMAPFDAIVGGDVWFSFEPEQTIYWGESVTVIATAYAGAWAQLQALPEQHAHALLNTDALAQADCPPSPQAQRHGGGWLEAEATYMDATISSTPLTAFSGGYVTDEMAGNRYVAVCRSHGFARADTSEGGKEKDFLRQEARAYRVWEPPEGQAGDQEFGQWQFTDVLAPDEVSQ